jgi:hypothetical protein
MGPKRKEFLKPGKPKGKLKAPEPQTENDFLEAADEHEQAAGKWPKLLASSNVPSTLTTKA